METKNIGRYEIQSQLGQTAIATTYLAHDPTTDMDVVIKLLNPNLLNQPDIRPAYIREARILSLLENPSIVPMYNLGEYEGQLYIVMAYIGGGSLADHVSDSPLTPNEAKDLLDQIAPALDEIHELGIAHQEEAASAAQEAGAF